jgi:hypothetical protein
MMRARSRSLALAALVPLAALSLAAAPVRADDTIKHPGDHPQYSVEAEPHLLLGWGGGWGGGGFGIGGRFSIPIVENGFVPSINNSVAIGFGLDVMFYNSCYYSNAQGCSATGFVFPVVMQWNFFVAQRWSVFGEPGLAIYHNSWNCNGGCPGGGPADTFLEPALYLGGRYHITDSISLTMRIGWPSFSFGGSFFL